MHADAYEDLLSRLTYFCLSHSCCNYQCIALVHSYVAHTSCACHVSNIMSNAPSINLVCRELEDEDTDTATHSWHLTVT